MEVFTGSADHTTATAPDHVGTELKDKMRASAIQIYWRRTFNQFTTSIHSGSSRFLKVNRKKNNGGWIEKSKG
jgi:hypothetical protein